MTTNAFTQVHTVAAVVAVPQPPKQPQPSNAIFYGFLILAVLVLAVMKAVQIWWFPDYQCRGCKGAGRFYGSNRKASRACRRCGGMGRRIRFGRRAWNYFRKTWRDAS